MSRFESREGQKIPDVTIPIRVGSDWSKVTSAELFGGKTVIVFSLPGAFTPTCSSAHVPRYHELAPAFAKLGVDDIVCVSVNDTFVMNAWKVDQHADNITFLPDGNGEFTDKMGMLIAKNEIGFGKRSWRYSMLVRDGVIEKMFIEEDVPGDPYAVSDADTMFRYLANDGDTLPADVVLFTKPGCGHCTRAKNMLTEKGIAFEEVASTPRSLRAVSGLATTPQVFVDGKHIGGADELAQFLAN